MKPSSGISDQRQASAGYAAEGTLKRNGFCGLVKRAWSSYLHFLNLQAGGKDASRSHAKVEMIDSITPHMFRHTYATLLYDSGVDIKSAQKFLGHADPAITFKIYTHLSKEQEQRSMEAFNAHTAARN